MRPLLEPLQRRSDRWWSLLLIGLWLGGGLLARTLPAKLGVPLFVTATNGALGLYLLARFAQRAGGAGTAGKWAGRAVLVFGVSVVLRILLTLTNADSHDGHYQIVNFIVNEHRLPTLQDCVQCYSPKLYYVVASFFVELLGLADTHARIMVAQGLSCAAGLLTMSVLGRWLFAQAWSGRARFVAFAVVALNPNVIGFAAMGSNDSWVFLFTVLALVGLLGAVREPRPAAIGWVAWWTLLAALTKGSAMVLFGVTLIGLGLRLCAPVAEAGRRRASWIALIAYAGLFVLLVPRLGQYDRVAATGGTLIFNPPQLSPFPDLFRETLPSHETVGVRSIADALFTFRLVDLIEHPQRRQRFAHEDSLWTSLHGGYHSVYFCRAPHSWTTNSSLMDAVARASFLFGLVPLALLLAGLAAVARRLGQTWRGPGWRAVVGSAEWILFLALVAYLAAEVAWTLAFRDSDAMRPVYLFPALLAFAAMVGWGVEWVGATFAVRRPAVLRAIDVAMAALLALYVVQGVNLTIKLGALLAHEYLP